MPYHPHPPIIICTSFGLLNWLQRFYRITMSLKRPGFCAEKGLKAMIYYYYLVTSFEKSGFFSLDEMSSSRHTQTATDPFSSTASDGKIFPRVILPAVTLGTIRPEDSGAAQNATEFQHQIAQGKLKSPAVWACLGVYPVDMPRTPYRASEGKRSQ